MKTDLLKISTKKLAKEYIKAGVHYGHQPKDWNPKMAPYILYEKYGYHIIDLIKTIKFLRLAGSILEKKARQGKKILFVGTTKIAAPKIEKYALESKSFFVNYRWLGGMLTNWLTLKKQVEKLKLLENENLSDQNLSKKELKKKEKELERLQRFFQGIKNMNDIPDIVILTNQLKEILVIRECFKLGIPTICLVDSNCDPDLVPYPIPANDDSPSSIDFILKYLSSKINKGHEKRQKSKKEK
jgi:small subunit ribosomal protein S2